MKRFTHGMSRRNFAKSAAAGAAATALPMSAGARSGRYASPAFFRAQDAVTLSYFYPVGVAGPLAQVMQEMVDEFNAAHPDIVVEASFTGSYADTATKVQTAVQAGNPPDVAVMLATDKQTMLDLDAILAVSDLEQAEGFDPDDFQPMKANFGILPELEDAPKGKRDRQRAYAERALADLESYLTGRDTTGRPN